MEPQRRRTVIAGAAFLAVIVILVVLVVLGGGSRTSSPSAVSASTSAPQPAAVAASRVLHVADLPPSANANNQLRQTLTDANSVIGRRLFLNASNSSSQALTVTIDNASWNALSSRDQNELFAAVASAWATVWQKNHRGGLQNGLLLRFEDSSHRVVRDDVFRRQG